MLLRQESRERIRVDSAQNSYRAKNSACSHSQSENLTTHSAFGREVLPQLWGIISTGVDTAPEPYNR